MSCLVTTLRVRLAQTGIEPSRVEPDSTIGRRCGRDSRKEYPLLALSRKGVQQGGSAIGFEISEG
jgi:hypothetical protein